MTRASSELAHLFRQLKAHAAARALPKLADRARQEEWSYEKFAATLLKTETDSRDSHGGQARIKAARFPARKTLEEFDFAFQTSVPRNAVLNRVARDRGLKGEVELLERLAGRKPRGFDPGLAAVAVATVGLGLEQRRRELLIAPFLLAGAVGELGQRPGRGVRL